MPPKAKFSREEIVSAALALVRKEGRDALTARSLAARLNSSARPIFTVFKGMDEVVGEVTLAAKHIYDGYIERGLEAELPFKGVGTQYIQFAVDEPKLFQLLFMVENSDKPNIENVMTYIENNYSQILTAIRTQYSLDKEKTLRLYRHLWMYTHGIAALCATKTCGFTAEQISDMMTDVFVAMLKRVQAE